jgi:hypothetical protein
MTRIEGAAIAGVIFAIRWLNAQNNYQFVDDFPFQEIGGRPAWLALYRRVASSPWIRSAQQSNPSEIFPWMLDVLK